MAIEEVGFPRPDRAPVWGGVLEAGMVLNETFRIQRLLAEGGMGMVYLATHQRHSGRFVVKTLHPKLGMQVAAHLEVGRQERERRARDWSVARARVQREAEVLARLAHPNIVKVVDFNETTAGVPYLVMEHLEGRTLNELARSRTLTPWDVAAIIRDLASGLAAAHAVGVFHRDVKPENVISVPVPGRRDIVKLIDFGVSNLCIEAERRTGDRVVMIGTPSYMAPEQILGGWGGQAEGKPEVQEEVDGRSDAFALAAIAFELLAHRQAFSDPDDARLLERIVHGPTPRLAGRVPFPADAIDAVLERGLAKRPAARFPTVIDFAAALDEAVRADLGPPPPESAHPLAQPRPVGPVDGDADGDPDGPPTGVGAGAARPLEAERRGSSAVKTRALRRLRRAGRGRGRRLPVLVLASAVVVAGLVVVLATPVILSRLRSHSSVLGAPNLTTRVLSSMAMWRPFAGRTPWVPMR
jgi:serine/threonine-protein kinase